MEWTAEDDEVLRRSYPRAPWMVILRTLEPHSRKVIYSRACRVGLKRETREVSWAGKETFRRWASTGNSRRGRYIHPTEERAGVGGKICVGCQSWLPLEKFAVHRECSGGRRAVCVICDAHKPRRGDLEARANRVAATVRWQKRNPEKVKILKASGNHRRHKRKMMGPGVRTSELRDLLERSAGKCYYCGVAGADTVDHRTPISRGGLHQISNLVVACRGCNFRKHSRTDVEFIEILKKGE